MSDLNDDNIESVVEWIKSKYENVPFGYSNYHTETFILGDKAPHKLYRDAIYQASGKIRALEETKYKREKLKIDIDELKDKYNHCSDKFEQRRIELDIEYKTKALNDDWKVINDCIMSLSVCAKVLKTLPDMTREQFELAEAPYWKNRLVEDGLRDVKTSGNISKGTLEALNQIGLSVVKNELGELVLTEFKPLQLEAKEGK